MAPYQKDLEDFGEVIINLPLAPIRTSRRLINIKT